MDKAGLEQVLKAIEAEEAFAVDDPERFFRRTGLEQGETPHVTIVRHFAGRRKEVLVGASGELVAELVAAGVVPEDEAKEAAAARAA